MFHTAQTDLADSPAQTLASNAHRRALLTAVLGEDEAGQIAAERSDGEPVVTEPEDKGGRVAPR